jgi:T5SS/PEP-CTERM-associated repeat protein
LILSSGGASVLETDVTRIANVAGSTGVVRVSNLEWNGGNLRVGHAGTGTLTIDDNAKVSSTNASIGHFAGAMGTATVQGGGSWTASGNYIIGREGTGSLTVTNGSSVTGTVASIGSASTGDGDVTVAGTDAMFEATDSLTVGEGGEGTLSISSGGALTSVDAFVGRLNGSDGHVSLLSGGRWTTTGRLSIGGDAGTGVAGGMGLVEIAGGRLEVGQEIVLFTNGELRLGDASLDVATVTVQTGGEFNWTDGILSVEQFNGDLINEGGVLTTRGVTGTITIEGSYAQESGSVLSLGIAGEVVNNEFDSVVIDDTAFLDGELRLQLIDLFEPEPDAVYTILEATDLFGSFTNVANGERLTDISNLGSFVVHYGMGSPFDPHHVVLTNFKPILHGDYNDNGVVDAADYVVWRDNIGTSNPLPNDPTGGTIGGDQYGIWLENFGRTRADGSGASAGLPGSVVPEPAAGIVVSGGVLLSLSKLRRLRRRLRRWEIIFCGRPEAGQ